MSNHYSEEVVSEEEDEFASASEGEDAPPFPVQIDDKSQKTATGKGAITLDSREQEKESTFDKNVEQPLTASTPNTHTTPAGQQETSGWSSWGSWLSSAVSTATEAIVMGDVDSLYNQANTITTTIRHVAAEQVDRVYETLDPDFTNDNTIRESASNGQPSISSENHGSKDKVNQEVEGQTGDAIRDTAEVLLSTIDKTFDFASNVLGNAVLGGYNKLSTESAKLQEQIQVGRLSEQLQANRLIEPIGNLADRIQPNVLSEKEVDPSRVINRTVDVGGNVVSTGLGALELLGRRAIDVINERGLIRSSSSSSERLVKFDQISHLTVKQLFESNTGSAHLEAIKSLTDEALEKYEILLASGITPDIEQIEQIERNLVNDAIPDAVQETDNSVLAAQADLKLMVGLLEKMEIKASAIVRQLRTITRKLGSITHSNVAAFENDWKELEQDIIWEEPLNKRSQTKEFFESSIRANYEAGIRVLANFGEKSCEQMLRLAEAFLVRIAENRLNDDEEKRVNHVTPAKISEYLRDFAAKLLTEVHFVAGTYIKTIQAIVTRGKTFSTSFETADWDILDQQVLMVYEQLHTDSGTVITYIQHASSSISNILKLMVAES